MVLLARLARLAIAAVTAGCGRSDLLAAYEATPPANDATTGDREAGQSDGAPDAREDGAIDASSSDGSTFDAAGDAGADANPTELPDGACGPGTCDGCCRDDGSCVVRRAASAAFCGSGGLGCISCPPGIACGVDTSDGTLVCGHFL
jgi:hypothetical protein